MSVTCSHVKPLPCWHCARYSFGYSIQGVDASGGAPAAAPIGPGNGLVLRYGCSEPALSNAVGFTQSTCRLPPSAPAPTRVLPNSPSGGGCCAYIEYATTQCVSLADRHAGMFWKSPPTSLPSGTVTFPPSSNADTVCRRSWGLGSTSVLSSWVSMPEPCEWPMNTTPRPLLYFARYSFHPASTPVYAAARASGFVPRPIEESVSCGYTGV